MQKLLRNGKCHMEAITTALIGQGMALVVAPLCGVSHG
jgi:hypothetical protein